MQAKKGTWVGADALYWFFYLPMTAFVVIALVTIPQSLLKNTIQPIALDAEIMHERFVQKLSAFNPVFGVEYGTINPNFKRAASLALSEKKYAYKISYFFADKSPAADNEVYGNKEFYDDAIPLTPYRYKRFTENKSMVLSGKQVLLTIDQVFPEKYDRQ